MIGAINIGNNSIPSFVIEFQNFFLDFFHHERISLPPTNQFSHGTKNCFRYLLHLVVFSRHSLSLSLPHEKATYISRFCDHEHN